MKQTTNFNATLNKNKMNKNILTAVIVIVLVIVASIKKGKCSDLNLITDLVANGTLTAVDIVGNGTKTVLKLIRKVDIPVSLSDLPEIPIIDTLRKTVHCKPDPDDYLTVPQIIRRHGYPSESHTVQTLDGYLLGVHRIPGNKQGKKGGQPILLQHGLFGSSYDYLVDGNTTLAFILADNGYDVWLGNARGNDYSRAHVKLCPHGKQFWDFTWHEMGTKDLPAVIETINAVTGSKGNIIYIGHSMGTTMSFVLASTHPEVAKNLKLIISLAPTAYMTHIVSPIRYLAPFSNDLNWIANNLGFNEFEPSKEVLKILSYSCLKNYTYAICNNIMLLFLGFDRNEFNPNLLPRLFSHDPAGVSTKTIVHYAQEINTDGSFQQFDYGRQGNIAKYGTPSPPQYNLTEIKNPYYLIYAENDRVTSYIDVERLAKKLPNLAGTYKVPNENFGHLDFIIGTKAYELVYEQILKVMQNYTENEIE